jgi:hypothetical protein
MRIGHVPDNHVSIPSSSSFGSKYQDTKLDNKTLGKSKQKIPVTRPHELSKRIKPPFIHFGKFCIVNISFAKTPLIIHSEIQR